MNYIQYENRLARILTIVEQSHSATTDSIATKLGVSTKTVRNDIKELNDSLKGYGLIDNKNGNYVLYVIDQIKFKKVYTDIFKQDYVFNSPKKRTAYILHKLMDSDVPYLTDDLAEEMNIGRTTLIGDLKRLRQELEDYNLSIVGKTNTGLLLKGNEIDIRLFILENMYEFIYGDYALDEDISDLIRKISEESYLATNTIDYFIKSFTVTLGRLLNGYTIKDLSKKYEDLTNTSAFIFINKVADEVEKKIHTKIPKNERIFMALPIVGMRTPMNVDGVKDISVSDEAIELVEDIVSLIKKEMNITITAGDLFDEFVYHVSFMLNRLKFGIKLKNPVIDDIKEKYSVAYKMAELAKDLIQDKFDEELSKDEIGFLAVYFGVFISESNFEERRNYSIAIICGTGRVTARLVESQLKKIVHSQTKIDVFSGGQVNIELLNKYDLVCSTVKVNCETTTPIIYLREIFDEVELRKKIERVTYTEKLEIPLLQGMDSLVLSILDEDKFFVLDNEFTYIENINKMIDNLYKNGYVDKDFKERINTREANSTMVFDKYIAFPHVVNYKSDKVVLALGVSEESIVVGDNRVVKLVFLLGIPEEVGVDETILIKLYNEIISIASNTGTIDAISKIKSYKELLLYFIKESDIFR